MKIHGFIIDPWYIILPFSLKLCWSYQMILWFRFTFRSNSNKAIFEHQISNYYFNEIILSTFIYMVFNKYRSFIKNTIIFAMIYLISKNGLHNIAKIIIIFLRNMKVIVRYNNFIFQIYFFLKVRKSPVICFKALGCLIISINSK
jgi:hypothetical protein